MKTLVLVLALLVVGAGAAVAEPVTFDVYAGWNLMAVPQAPLNPAVSAVFNDPEGNPYPTLDMLSTFDPIGGSDFPYNADTQEFWGGMMLGQGYWFNCELEQATIQYEAFPNGLPDTVGGPKTDMWISLPGADFDGDGVPESGNWHMVGNPFNHFVALGEGGVNVKFTDGNEVKTWSEAAAEPGAWVANTMFGFSAGSDIVTNWTPDALNFLIPSFGYWLQTNQPNLAMIIDANQEYIFPEE